MTCLLYFLESYWTDIRRSSCPKPWLIQPYIWEKNIMNAEILIQVFHVGILKWVYHAEILKWVFHAEIQKWVFHAEILTKYYYNILILLGTNE